MSNHVGKSVWYLFDCSWMKDVFLFLAVCCTECEIKTLQINKITRSNNQNLKDECWLASLKITNFLWHPLNKNMRKSDVHYTVVICTESLWRGPLYWVSTYLQEGIIFGSLCIKACDYFAICKGPVYILLLILFSKMSISTLLCECFQCCLWCASFMSMPISFPGSNK